MIIAIIILCAVLLVTILAIVLKKSLSKEDVNDPFQTKECNLKIVEKYLNDKELYFYKFMTEHLDSQYYILPKVGVDNLVEPQHADLRQYNKIKSKYIDFVVFDLKTQKPLIAVDLVEYEVSSQNPYFDKDISSALNLVEIPIWTKYVENFYVWSKLEMEMNNFLKVPDSKIESNSSIDDNKKDNEVVKEEKKG